MNKKIKKLIISLPLFFNLNLYSDSSLENILRNKNINLNTPVSRNTIINYKIEKSNQEDLKYTFNKDFRKFEKKIKEKFENYGLVGGHKNKEYYLIEKECSIYNFCIGTGIKPGASLNTRIFLKNNF